MGYNVSIILPLLLSLLELNTGPAHEDINSYSAQEGIDSKGNIIDIWYAISYIYTKINTYIHIWILYIYIYTWIHNDGFRPPRFRYEIWKSWQILVGTWRPHCNSWSQLKVFVITYRCYICTYSYLSLLLVTITYYYSWAGPGLCPAPCVGPSLRGPRRTASAAPRTNGPAPAHGAGPGPGLDPGPAHE